MQRKRRRVDQPTRAVEASLKSERQVTHDNQDGIELLVISLGKVLIVLCRLLPVHRIEVEAGVA